MPVAAPVAGELRAPLDVLLVRKLGLPGQEEVAIGALASGGIRVLNDEIIELARIDAATVEQITAREQREIQRREEGYRRDTPLDPADRIIVLVDDGLATGATMRAAVSALRTRRPRKIIVAVPVGSPEACASLRDDADSLICLLTPEQFESVGRWYLEFTQTSDQEVRRLLDEHRT